MIFCKFWSEGTWSFQICWQQPFFYAFTCIFFAGFTGWIQSLPLANLICQGWRNCTQAFGFVRRDRIMRDFSSGCCLLAANHSCSESPVQSHVQGKRGWSGERAVLSCRKGHKWSGYFTEWFLLSKLHLFSGENTVGKNVSKYVYWSSAVISLLGYFGIFINNLMYVVLLIGYLTTS